MRNITASNRLAMPQQTLRGYAHVSFACAGIALRAQGDAPSRSTADPVGGPAQAG